MAENKVMVEIGAEDKFSDVVNKFNQAMDDSAKKSKTSFEQATDASKKFALGLGVAGVAVGAFALLAKSKYDEAELAQAQLTHAVIDVTHATQDQLKATEDLADELERKGVLDGDNIKTGLAQLSTFGLSNDAVRNLGGSLADLAVNQFGVNASGEQLSQSANMIAKALNGQFGVLEKSGIRFSDAQKHMIQFGTETQKVSAINEGFAQNLKLTNEVARQTGEGIEAHLKVQLENVTEAFGKIVATGLNPMITAFSGWIDSMGGADGILQRIMEVFERLKPFLPIISGLIVGALTPAFLAFGTTLLFTTIPAMITAAAALAPFIIVGGLVAAAATLIYMAWKNNWFGIRDFLGPVIEKIIGFIKNLNDRIHDAGGVWELFKNNIMAIGEIIWTYVSTTFQNIGNAINSTWISVELFWIDTWTRIGNWFSDKLNSITDFFKGWYDKIYGWISSILDKLGLVTSKANDTSNLASKPSSSGGSSKVSSKGKAFGGMVEGEAGIDNLLVPLSAGEIVLNAAQQSNVAAAMNSGRSEGGVKITIVGNSFYGDDKRFAEKIGDSIFKMLQPHISYPSR